MNIPSGPGASQPLTSGGASSEPVAASIPALATTTTTPDADATAAQADVPTTKTPTQTAGTSATSTGLLGQPFSRGDCDALSVQLAAGANRLRERVQAGMPPDTYATARRCLDGLDAAQRVIESLRLTVGLDTAPAPITPKR